MPREVHGARFFPGKQHPVLDIKHWEGEFPLGDERRRGHGVDCPRELAFVEHARRIAASKGDLGPSVPADLFVWANTVDSERQWLTRIGGVPWREAGKVWPIDEQGLPLHFLGQFCFSDSKDIVSFELPGEVALIFGRWDGGWVSMEDSTLEWSPLTLKKPLHTTISSGKFKKLPFTYSGVVHRTVQYTDSEKFDATFEAAGWKDGGWKIANARATCVSTRADLPQGWPFEEGDGNTLVAVLSSVYVRGRWPMCDVPRGPVSVNAEGKEFDGSEHGLNFGVADAGAIWIYRDRKGKFHLDAGSG